MIFSLLCAFLVAVPLTPSSETSAESVQRTYDLNALRVFHQRGASSMPLAAQPDRFDELDDLERGEWIESGQILALLRATFPRQLEQPDTVLWAFSGNTLVARASEEFHQQLEQFFATLFASFGSSQELLLDFVEVAPGTPVIPSDALVPEKLAVEWLSSAPGKRDSQRLRVNVGSTARLDLRRRLRLLSDYNVELAPSGVGLRPAVNELLLGTCIDLRAVPFPDGLALNLVARHQEAEGELRKRPVKAPGWVVTEPDGVRAIPNPPELEHLPVVARSLAVDAWLPHGQALLTRLTFEGKPRVLVVRRSPGAGLAAGKVSPAGDRTLILAPGECWSLPQLEAGPSFLAGLGVWDGPGQALRTELRSRDFEVGQSWIETAFRDCAVHAHGPWLLSAMRDTGEPGELERTLEAGLRAAQPQHAAILAVHFSRAGTELGELRLPLRLGGQAMGVVGRLSNDLVDFDVEVVSSAAVSDPELLTRFHGLALEASLVSGVGGLDELRFEALVSLDRGAPRVVATLPSGERALELSDQDGLRVSEQLTLKRGEPKRWSLGSPEGIELQVELR